MALRTYCSGTFWPLRKPGTRTLGSASSRFIASSYALRVMEPGTVTIRFTVEFAPFCTLQNKQQTATGEGLGQEQMGLRPKCSCESVCGEHVCRKSCQYSRGGELSLLGAREQGRPWCSNSPPDAGRRATAQRHPRHEGRGTGHAQSQGEG